MLEQAIILSLKITAIHILFSQGMLLGWFRIECANFFDERFGKKWSRYIQKPLWDCMSCMASLWTLILTFGGIKGIGYTISIMLIVCAINAIIEKFLDYEDNA